MGKGNQLTQEVWALIDSLWDNKLKPMEIVRDWLNSERVASKLSTMGAYWRHETIFALPIKGTEQKFLTDVHVALTNNFTTSEIDNDFIYYKIPIQ